MTAKDLKNTLLQEAVQGKLVPQIASEGNARDLLEEIRKEKLSHGLDFANAKSGKRKSKKETALAGSNPCDIPEDEIPFDIPENWCWCRLGEIIDLLSGQDFEPDYYNNIGDGIPYITGASNIENNTVIINRWTPTPKCIALKGDLLLVCKGSGYGTTVFADFDKAHIARQIMSLKSIGKYNCLKYVEIILYTQIKNIKAQGKGVIPGIDRNSVLSIMVPLPPLAEQKRIVSAIEKFMPLIEEYGKKETELKALNEQIGTLTKKAILQEAVQGKLVPQIAADGNAKDLLEEIKKGKAKVAGKASSTSFASKTRTKELSPITEEEIPFDIPESWCWCRLGEIVPFGTCQNAEPSEIKEDDWILDLEDIEKDSGKILAFKTKKQVDSKSTKHIFKEGYVLYSKLRPYLNKCVIAPKDGFCTSEILPLDFGDKIYNKYAQIYLMSPFFVEYTNSLSFGVKMPRLGTEDGKRALFPLPPLAEQKRIVEAIEKMLPLCEKLGV